MTGPVKVYDFKLIAVWDGLPHINYLSFFHTQKYEMRCAQKLLLTNARRKKDLLHVKTTGGVFQYRNGAYPTYSERISICPIY